MAMHLINHVSIWMSMLLSLNEKKCQNVGGKKVIIFNIPRVAFESPIAWIPHQHSNYIQIILRPNNWICHLSTTIILSQLNE